MLLSNLISNSKLANDFGEFFIRKIDLIKEQIESIDVQSPDVHFDSCPVHFEEFAMISENDLKKIITDSSNAYCDSEPIPTRLLKSCVDVLLPILTKMINLSLREACVKMAWKHAIVIPLLKKLGLDLIFPSFRPVSNLPFISKLTEKAVITQILGHSNEHAPLPKLMSAY